MARDCVSDDGVDSTSALWWPPAKVAGRYLAPYLHGRDEHEALERLQHLPHIPVEVILPAPQLRDDLPGV